MFHVEEMKPQDFLFAVELANTMGWNMSEDDFEFNMKLEPHGCLVLFNDSERAGVATCISYGRAGWFGNLIVKKDYRQQGAGTLLVNHALKYLRNLGVETVGLYAYQHLVNFYGKLGFQYNTDFVVLKADKAKGKHEGTTREATEQDIPSLVKLDSECFGVSREKLLKLVLEGEGNICYVSAENDDIHGFAAGKVYYELAEVGPLVCRRSHMGYAGDLLQTLLGKLAGLEVWMCLPAFETALLGTALQVGFKEEFRLARMFLGPAVAGNCLYSAESLERG